MARYSLAVLVLLFFLNAPLSAGNLRVDGQLISDAPQGTPPIQVGSTTPVPNLNADLLDGRTAADFAGVTELATAGGGVGVHWKNLINVPGVEIDQDCAVNTGCDTGTDSAGFPVTITEPGSYRLAGHLTHANANVDMIRIDTSNVLLDLNGFTMTGPVTCSGTPVTSCVPSGGTGNGIFVPGAAGSSVTIMNGSIQGMGHDGIDCTAPCKIIRVHVSQNERAGISTFSNDAVVENVTAYRNGFSGILMNGVLRNCQSTANGFNGIQSQSNGTLAIDNCTATQNASTGFSITGSVANSKSHGNTGNGFVLGNGTTAIGNSAHDNVVSGFVNGATSGLTLRSNAAHNNGVHGFNIDRGILIGNSASENGNDGFECGDCVMLDNLSINNVDHGAAFLGASSVAAWGRNTLIGNGNDVIGIVADMGNNFCDGVAC